VKQYLRKGKTLSGKLIVIDVRFEVFTAMTMKETIFWDLAPCIFGYNGRFGGTYCLHHQGR
jgi:hypothetical protein